MTQPTVYRIEFGKVGETYPVPPITLEHADPNEFARKVAAHAIPYLTPVLAEMGRPELADCFFRVDPKDPTYGDFLWIDLVGNKGAQFCPARITPATTKENPMSDENVQHTWNLVREADGDEAIVELLADGETVRVDGGDGESYSTANARRHIEERLLPKYTGRGYRLVRDYAVNEPAVPDDAVEDDAEPDGKPECCPECGSPVEYEPRHCTDLREGEAWLCTGCQWGEWLTA